jgi:sugar/nucleoside kinase (ribokinase family)
MSTPDFVVVGHAAVDIAPGGGWRMGGTVTFAAVQAHRLGVSVGVLTSSGDDCDVQAQLPFAEVVRCPSTASTTFENHYEQGRRTQRVHGMAARISIADLPRDWQRAPIALIGPVLDELDPALASAFDEASLVGVSPQGWLRAVDAEGNVARTAYVGPPFWRGADAVFVSDEDLAGGRDDAAPWTADVPIVVMTESYRGAQVHAGGRWRRIDALPAEDIDPTGAGDTLATAFLIRFRETGDLDEALRFGAAAASLSIAGPATETMATREEIEAHMRRYPEVVLR